MRARWLAFSLCTYATNSNALWVVYAVVKAADEVLKAADQVTHPQQLFQSGHHRHHNNQEAEQEARKLVVARRMNHDYGISETFLTEIRDQYGVRLAFLFAFMQLCEQCVMSIAWPAAIGSIIGASVMSWSNYLRVVGVVGLLVPAWWAPWFLGRWDRLTCELSLHWKIVGVNEDILPNPYYRKGADYRCRRAAWILLLVGMIMLIFIISILILEWETLITCTPMCGSWFHETIWRDFVSSNDADRKHSWAQVFTFAIPSCFPGPEEVPFPVDGQPPTRGLMSFSLGAIEGILIGGVYSELFALVAEQFSRFSNVPDWRVFERIKIDFIYSFEVASSFFYWLIMAFCFIPFSFWAQGSFFATNSRIPLSGIKPVFSTRAPCFTMADGVCDEWTGRCAPGTDSADCAGYGCIDPSAVNFRANATRAVPEQFVPGSLFDDSIPSELRCVYNAFIAVGSEVVAGGGDSVVVLSRCPTPNDGVCDEPLSCLAAAAAAADDGYALPVYEQCLHTQSSSRGFCAVASDVNDCAAALWEIIGDCAETASCTSGLMAVLQSRHVEGDSPEAACEALLDPHGENPFQAGRCSGLAGVSWPQSSGNSCNGNVEAEFAVQTRCKTTAALNCTTTCDVCAGCLLGESANMDGRCENYALCVACQGSCSDHSDCFPQSIVSRATAAGSTVCERMGLVNNGWCDEEPFEGDTCTAIQTLVDVGSERGLCREGEDSADCGQHSCNFGCQPTCEDKCHAVFPNKESADACACVFGCEMARGLPNSPSFPAKVTGDSCVQQCDAHCYSSSSCTCGCGGDGECCIKLGGDKGRCFNYRSDSNGLDPLGIDAFEPPCAVGCNLDEDTNYDPHAKVHWQPACANTSSVLAKTSDLVRIWMYDRRFNLQLNLMLPIPITLSMGFPMLFEVLLPFLCLSWQQGNRRGGKRSKCARCCCCRRKSYEDDVGARRNCCVRSMNCFMCDDDQGVGARAPSEALPDVSDQELAQKLEAALEIEARKDVRQGKLEQLQFDLARVKTAGDVRTKIWKQTSRGKAPLAAADAIIVESQAAELEFEVELVKLCIYLLNVQMFTIVFPELPLVVWFFLVLRLRNDLTRLTALCRRNVPMYPTAGDPLGGLLWWLEKQTYASAICVVGFFVLCTGCMEAWFELFNPEACSIAKPSNLTHWKFPACSVDFSSELAAEGYNETIDQAGVGWPIGAPLHPEVMSINRAKQCANLAFGLHLHATGTFYAADCSALFCGVMIVAGTCWQESPPELPECPFHASTSEFVDANSFTSDQ